MNFYDDLVMQTQMNYSKYYHIYASGSTPYQLTDQKPLPYSEQINRLVQEVKEADCVVVGGASGLSAAGGGDFYYEDNAENCFFTTALTCLICACISLLSASCEIGRASCRERV